MLLRFGLFVDVDFPLILYDLETMYPNTPTVIIFGRTDDREVETERRLSDRHTTGHRQNPGRHSTANFILAEPRYIFKTIKTIKKDCVFHIVLAQC